MEDNNKSLVTFPIGTLLRDGDRIGIVYREIKSGTWTDQPLFNWRTNYEIYYDDGSVCVMGGDTIQRLIETGHMELIEERDK